MEKVDKSQPNQAQVQKKPKVSPRMKKPPLEKPQLPTSKNQASEEKFRRLFEAAQDGILLLDAGTGEITDANPIIEAILGYSRTELIGKKLWEIDAFKDLTANQAAFTLLQKKRYFRNDDLAIRTKDGQWRNIEFVSNVYQAGRQKTIQCNFRDITESRLAVTSLVESEERYRDLFDNASLGIFKTSANGRIISVNPAFARMFGYGSPEEFKSLVRNAADVFVDPQRRAEIIRLQAEHPELTGFENLYRRKDGSTFIGSLTVRQVTGRDGREALFEGFIEDISERIRAERALRESELKSRIIFENSTAGVALVGLDGKYLMVNPAFCEIHGYSAEELLKMNFFQLTHPDDIELSRKTAQEVVRGGSKSTRFFKRYIHKDGHTIWAEVSSALVYGIDGQPEYFITHVSDITERKRMEEALQKSEAELRALIEEIPAIVYTESADEPGKTLYISPQIETITGYTPAEWMRSANFWYEIVHPEDLEYLQAEDERTNRTGVPFHAEYRILKRDGSVLWILDEAILIRDDSGKALFWQGIMHDISDKKQAEKALQESEARYQLISTVASDYMFSTQLDADGSLTLTWVAGAFEAITGYTKEEYIAHGGWRSTLHPDDLAVDDRDMEKLRAGQSVITEVRTFTKSGKMVWVRVYAQPVLNAENKELVSIYGAVQDITERKQAEEALKLNMEQLVALNQASQTVATSLDLNQVLTKIVELAGKVGGPDYISIVLVDENGRISSSIENIPDTLSLQQRVRKRGLTNWIIQTRQPVIVDEVGEDGIIRPRIGKGAPRTVNPDLVAKGIKSFIGLPLMVENHVEGVAYLHSLRQATFHDKLTLLTTFANQAAIAIGKARLYDAVQKELADRIKAEQAQQNSELMFRALFELSPDAVVLIDPQDPNVEWPIIDCNAAACRMNGYRRDELIGHSIDILNENSETPDGRAIYFKRLREDGPQKLETNHLHKSGRAFPVEISTSLIKVGERELVIGIDRDITERKRAEASLQFSLKQAEHNRGMIFALNKAGQAVQRARSPEEVYISIQEQVKHLGFTATVLELKDSKEGLRIAYLDYDSRLVRMAEKLTGLSKNDFRFHPRQGSIFQRVLEQGETVHIADAAQAVAEVLPEKLNALARPIRRYAPSGASYFCATDRGGKGDWCFGCHRRRSF